MTNKDLIKKVVEGSKKYKLGHCGSALSCLDIVDCLYKDVLKEDDLFILSKGHGSMALYSVLEQYGHKQEWAMHPELNENKGIYATTGSLGHGLPIGVGRAFAKKLKNKPGRVYVLMGDGEMAEGSVWESLILAKTLKLDNLTALIDHNKYGAVYRINEITSDDQYVLKKKLKAFGFNTSIVDGHNQKEFRKIKNKGLKAIIFNTIKGNGIDFLEESHAHGFNFFFEPEKYKEVMENLK